MRPEKKEYLSLEKKKKVEHCILNSGCNETQVRSLKPFEVEICTMAPRDEGES